ncbi:hypothetical protein M0R45_030752 [Rubus argutus]|uniref:Uncharacterized protein n=1 Tax=Rubus argutus TaxID=59490 RepID=A0AAW1WBK7_RUBAR
MASRINGLGRRWDEQGGGRGMVKARDWVEGLCTVRFVFDEMDEVEGEWIEGEGCGLALFGCTVVLMRCGFVNLELVKGLRHVVFIRHGWWLFE